MLSQPQSTRILKFSAVLTASLVATGFSFAQTESAAVDPLEPFPTQSSNWMHALPSWLPLVMLGFGLLILIAVFRVIRVKTVSTTDAELVSTSANRSSRLAISRCIRRFDTFARRLILGPGHAERVSSSASVSNHDLLVSNEQAHLLLSKLSQTCEEARELAARLALDLEERAARVESLLKRVDERIDRLAKLSSSATLQPPLPIFSSSAVTPPTSSNTSTSKTQQDAATPALPVHVVLNSDLSSSESISVSPNTQIPSVPPIRRMESLKEQVLRLHEQGQPSQQIAQQLSQPLAKVELIIALKPMSKIGKTTTAVAQ